MAPITRRDLLKGTAAVSAAAATSHLAAAASLTPSASEGPFYPTTSMRMADVDNDLVKVAGKVRQAGGEILQLSGRLMSPEGQPLAQHRIEIWQCDVNGKYLHTGDNRDIAHDSGFQGFGHDMTDDAGRYRFRTIKPARYPGRTPHIHVKVCIGDRELLTTQFYIDGEPDNRADGLYRRMTSAQAQSVSMVLSRSNDALAAVVDVTVQAG